MTEHADIGKLKRQCKTDLQDMIKSISENNNLSTFFIVEVISGRARNADFVNLRQYVAKKLRDKGYTYQAIGAAMNKNHSTITKLCRNRNMMNDNFQLFRECRA